MYPDTSPTTPVAIDHGLTLLADDQAAARPCRSSEQRPTTVGYGRVSRDPADLRAAVLELHRLGVHSEHIYLDQVGDRTHDGLQLALQTLTPGDTIVASTLNRLARSLAALHHLVDQLAERNVHLVIDREPFAALSPARLLQMLTEFQVTLVDDAIKDAEWVHRQRDDQRHPFHRVDAVQRVWLNQLFDAGVPRFQLGKHFGVSRATAFRVAAEPRN